MVGEVVENKKTQVTVNLGYTMNLGNFQSFRIDLGCTDQVRDSENVDQAMERVYEFVENKVIAKLEEAKKEIE
jgi:S-adenosylmethionine synthetase